MHSLSLSGSNLSVGGQKGIAWLARKFPAKLANKRRRRRRPEYSAVCVRSLLHRLKLLYGGIYSKF